MNCRIGCCFPTPRIQVNGIDSHGVDCLSVTQEVAGSSPVAPANLLKVITLTLYFCAA